MGLPDFKENVCPQISDTASLHGIDVFRFPGRDEGSSQYCQSKQRGRTEQQ
jgi:hypothetical protein